MRARATLISLILPALIAPAAAADSYATAEQVAWVRRAATNFVAAELNGDGAAACAILVSPLRATLHHRTCAERWDARLHALLRHPGGRANLHREQRSIARAAVSVHGVRATISLPAALAGDPSNRFLWTENCWMLTG